MKAAVFHEVGKPVSIEDASAMGIVRFEEGGRIIGFEEKPKRPRLEAILTELRISGIVATQRGPSGGTRLARPAKEITVADVIRAVEGPLAGIRGQRPSDTAYTGAAEHLPVVWVALRSAMRRVLTKISVVRCSRMSAAMSAPSTR